MIRKNIYKWHRSISIVIAVPVLMWTLSGILHPVMSTFKPRIKNQSLPALPVDMNKVRLSVTEALTMNGIESIDNFRLITLDGKVYYQVLHDQKDIPVYINVEDGKLLVDGDQKYAIQLSQYFLGDTKTAITDTQLVREFGDEYPFINRLLPVYKVSFQREDGLRIFVETFGDRMAFAVNDLRYGFSRFFSAFHSWSFLEALGSLRYVVIVVLCGLALFVAISGIYIYFISNEVRVTDRSNSYTKTRRLHRITSIFVSVTTLMFAFSGGYHAFEKIKPDSRSASLIKTSVPVQRFHWDSIQFFTKIKELGLLSNLSVVNMGTSLYWQANIIDKENKVKTVYLNVSTLQELNNGEEVYAAFLANSYSSNKTDAIVSINKINSFGGEYGFVNKRLPVMKVQYNSNGNERYYVETSSGKLSVRIEDKDLYEGLSFAFLHKFHFADSLGKTGRDVITVIAALANLIVVVIGLVLFFKKRRKSKVESLKLKVESLKLKAEREKLNRF
ncbi:PepSY-associated TM helix domain-containing protein [Sporocytophaga myxococcoides]|uniref:PepSY-associated TM helix domain-containing protein n=1 Tax=Sporocytophaga myxococcoides TaxID=153721 RepID=UPI0005EDA224|nr:PepSY-associated TM helix domain-containing protein [Sporocytophaga myxococcoides]